MISVVIVKVLRINFIWGFCLVDIYITSDEIKKYIFMIVLFNAIFPRVLEESGMVINIEDAEDSTYIKRMEYAHFIEHYDFYGLNQIAQ